MPELIDKPQKEKFKYPGVFDRSAKKVEEPIVEVSPDTEPEKPKRAPRKKKEAEEIVPTGRKQLKLGKIKG